MKPGSVPKSSRTSPSSAGRKPEPSVLRSLSSLSRWSPRTSTSSGPRSSAITGSALTMAPCGTPSVSATACTVVAPGVSTRCGASAGSGRPSTGCGVALAISTFAA